MPGQKVIFLDSAQATTKTLATGYASWILQEPFGNLPGAQICASQFSFTNFFINVSAAIGNNHFYYSNDPLDLTKFDITIPDGSYSFTDLNTFITNEVKAAQTGNEIFTLVANYSTNKIGVLFGNFAGWYIHFSAASPFTLLGFAALQNVPATQSNVAYYQEFGAATATFNNITNLKVSTNLSNDSISNTNQSSIILTAVPTVSVGSTQTTEIQNLLWLASTPLESKITEIRVQILDQNDATVNLSEDFTLTLIVRN